MPADRDLHVTLLILPPLEKYASSTRYGIQSREFGGTYNGRKSVHDGLSFMILSVRWVDGAAPQSRLRGKARRERIRKAMSEVNRSQVVDMGDMETLGKATARDQGATKGGQSKRRSADGNKENHPMDDAPAPTPSTGTLPTVSRTPDDNDRRDMQAQSGQAENGMQQKGGESDATGPNETTERKQVEATV